MNFRLTQPAVLIDINPLDELAGIRNGGDRLRIGALTRYRSLERDPMTQIKLPLIAEALPVIAHPQIRNRGTMGGNLANASPVGDMAPVLLALGATLQLRGPKGVRRMALDGFFTGYRTTALERAEYIQAIHIPRLTATQRFFAEKITKRHEDDIAAVSLALWLDMDESGIIRQARLGLGGMASVPMRAHQAEEALEGRRCDGLALEAACSALERTCRPIDDARASAAYRLHMAKVLLERAFEQGHGQPDPSGATHRQEPTSSVPSPLAHHEQARAHESAIKHVTGQAQYVDDLPEPPGLLHAAVGTSPIACGTLVALDLDAVRAFPGVVATLSAADVPGDNDIGAVYPGDSLLCQGPIGFHGQVLFAVAARSELAARRAVRQAVVRCEATTPLLDVQMARETNELVRPTRHLACGVPEQALQAAAHRLEFCQRSGAQEHFYLEGQVALAIPGEDDTLQIFSSTQHPSEIQKLVARVLAIPQASVLVEVRRMGGAFGGKETQAAQWACLAALLARHTGRPVKLRLPRSADMQLTGKRHPFASTAQVGYDDQCRIQAAHVELVADCGVSPDLSDGVVDRAMLHVDNAYHLPHVTVAGWRCRTNTVSHTAFRGFGAPQGMLVMERAMDDIAWSLGKDPLEVRLANLYRDQEQRTPYGQAIGPNPLPQIIDQLVASSDYWSRRRAILAANRTAGTIRRGLALVPVKFGVAFTARHLNQAGALLHIYTDGSIHLNHGGTEMGQGLNTKVAQIVAREFAVPFEQVAISATRTDKVPNTTPTAASSGTDLNGMAARRAALKLKARLKRFLARHLDVSEETIHFTTAGIMVGSQCLSLAEAAQAAHMARISLSATGFYRTPGIHFDFEAGCGKPFHYFAWGAAVSEVAVDSRTGTYQVLRVDILHDVGTSLNPALDIGQIEGGFVQGMGYMTTEEVVWDQQGRLTTTGPATYKIPTAGDVPPIFNVQLFERPNAADTVYCSKAVGEPPLMLAISVWSALRDAIASLADHRMAPELPIPATPEKVLWACEAMRRTQNQPAEATPLAS
jgi:xanthine dehydrogenase large subunit